MIFQFSIVQVHFVFCLMNFIVLFNYIIKYYHIMFIISRDLISFLLFPSKCLGKHPCMSSPFPIDI